MIVMNGKEKTSVLFVCTGNSCRSQMAEGFLREWGGDRVDVKSAGSHPAYEVSRTAIEVLREVGIDIMDQYPKSIHDFRDVHFDWVISLCDFARDFCTIFETDEETKRLHWSVRDPITASNDPAVSIDVYREVRDDIANRIVKWMDEELGIKIVYDPE